MITKEQYKYSDLTGKIIGCAMDLNCRQIVDS